MANTFSSFENRVISFDIETTGLDPSNLFGEKAPGLNQKGIKPRIWALGFHIPGQDTPQETQLFSANAEREQQVLTSNKFYKESGVWNDYVTRTKQGYTPSDSFRMVRESDGVGKALTETFNAAKTRYTAETGNFIDGGMVLIQNTNFENRWIGHIESEEANTTFSAIQRYKSNSNRQLYVPPEVSRLRSTIVEGMSAKEIDGVYDKIVMNYQAEVANVQGTGRYITGELMDFTSAMYSKAIAEGHLDPSYSKIGKNVELLSHVLLGEKEIHGAGSDAKQQSRIFEEVLGMRDRIQAGELTEKDKRVFAYLNNPANIKAQKESAAARNLIGFSNNIQNNIVNVRKEVGIVEVDIHDTVSNQNIPISFKRRVAITDPEEIMLRYEEVLDRNGDTEANRILEKLRAEEIAGNSEPAIERIKNPDVLSQLEDINQQNKDTLFSTNPNDFSTNDYGPRVERKRSGAKKVLSALGAEYESARNNDEILRAILPENKKIALGGAVAIAGGGMLWALSTGDSKERAEKFRRERYAQKAELYNDSTFNMLNPSTRPGIQYGWAKAQSDESIRHYEY